MEQEKLERLQPTLSALKALQRANDRNLQLQRYEGTARPSANSYRALHGRVSAELPDDFYITESLALDLDENADERAQLQNIQFVLDQLVTYLEDLLKTARKSTQRNEFEADIEDLRGLGRNLQDQILNMTRTTIKRALTNIEVDTTDEDLSGADFSGQNLRNIGLRKKSLVGANFSGAIMSGADLRKSDLTAANFSGANLENADLRKVVASQTNFNGAQMANIDLTKAALQQANLSGALLPDASLMKAALQQANLSGAELSSVSLRGADLSAADLSAANLSDASLEKANLTGANLRNANLRDAELEGAYLGDADLTGAVMPDGREYEAGMDLSAYEVSNQTPPTPPVPPTPPTPPTPPSASGGRIRIEIERDDEDEDDEERDKKRPAPGHPTGDDSDGPVVL